MNKEQPTRRMSLESGSTLVRNPSCLKFSLMRMVVKPLRSVVEVQLVVRLFFFLRRLYCTHPSNPDFKRLICFYQVNHGTMLVHINVCMYGCVHVCGAHSDVCTCNSVCGCLSMFTCVMYMCETRVMKHMLV